MARSPSIDRLALQSARQAQTEAAMLRRALGALRDGMGGLTHGIRAPVIRARRHMIKGSRTDSALLDGLAGLALTEFAGTGIFGENFSIKGSASWGGVTLSNYYESYDSNVDGSVDVNLTQRAAAQAAAYNAAQRIR